MLWSGEDLRGYGIRATDDVLGRVDDFYFDDARWAVRYLVADTARWLFGRKVLLGTGALGRPDAIAREVPVALTREQVKNSPDISTDQPVDRQREAELHAYYGWVPYWAPGDPVLGPGFLGAPGLGAPGLGVAVPAAPGSLGIGEDLPGAAPAYGGDADPAPRGDPHLRSEHELRGYTIAATDDDIGHVSDLLIDDEGWTVRYLVVGTGTWLPGRHVLVAPQWTSAIDWAERRVHVDLTRDQVRHSPDYDPSIMVERTYEDRLYGHYGRPGYWV